MNRIELTPYERLMLVRKPDRPGVSEFIDALFDDFIELHGDRLFRDDPAIVSGLAVFHGETVTVIGTKKGHTTQENIKVNFGMPSPEGYRKAIRMMLEAERFNRPVITFIDTPGAYPGIEAESNGQSNAIAECIACMSSLKVPVIAIITGEGNSGGAIALAVADKVCMLENSVYSILSPEGFASILWKDAARAPEACEIMHITAPELKEAGLIDEIIEEGEQMFKNIDDMLFKELKRLKKLSPEKLCNSRYMKFRKIDGLSQKEQS